MTDDDLDIDALVSPEASTRVLLEDLQRMAPFGPGNPEPMLALPDVRGERAKVLRGGHIRCTLAGEHRARLEAIAWRAQDSELGRRLLGGDGGLHVAGRLRANDWNGRVGVQLEIEDVADPRRAECVAWASSQARERSRAQGCVPMGRPIYPQPSRRCGPFVYRLGHQIFNLGRGVRFP